MNLRMENLPPFSVNLDPVFAKYRTVYIIGDVHDDANTFRTFLLEKGLAFVPAKDNVDYQNLSDYFVKPDVLLVFLGDVLYKTKSHFKSIMRFILNNMTNCLLILGNNSRRFSTNLKL